jgi:glycosyltransferase involved in cell wall biosynthesis
MARLQMPGYLVQQAVATRRLIRRGETDLVFAHWIVPQGLTAAWAVGGHREVPLAVHVHGGDAFLLKEIPRGRSIARYVVSRAGAVFASGSGIRDCLDEVLGYPSEAMTQPMGVHTELFARNEGASEDVVTAPAEAGAFPDGYVLFVGRMIEIKGVVYLVQSLPRILGHFPRIGLVLIGDGPERGNIEREIDRLGLGDSVRLLGRRPHSDVVDYLHHCRLAAVPSIVDDAGRTEGMPTTVIEAMAAGCRVVGSAVDGIPDIIRHGENGWLCRARDPDDLAEKILTALDERTGASIVRSALATAGNHDWGQVAKRYAQSFQDLVAGVTPTVGRSGADRS